MNDLIPDDFIEEVKQSADILTVIGQRVTLKKTGAKNWVGLCPFHSEKSPSFSVNPDKGMYHCFGCGASGTSLTFLVEHDGVAFREAVKELARNCGLALPKVLQESQSSSTGDDYDLLNKIYDALQVASKYFRYCLKNDSEALLYLKSRGIDGQTINKFMIGASPSLWQGLQEAFPDYSESDILIQAGLIKTKDSEVINSNRIELYSQEVSSPSNKQPPLEIKKPSSRRYDIFRHRIMFPIRDSRGRVQAFGGRIFSHKDDVGPKYLNSPESVVFHKSSALFGLYEARESIRKKKMVIVVEGYMDVVMLSQKGIENVVACMGTSITAHHIERLLTQTKSITFAFDGDKAGRVAAWRALLAVLPCMDETLDIRFLLLPDGLDPDEYVQLKGPIEFELCLKKTISLTEFFLSELKEKHGGLTSAECRARFASEAQDLVFKMPKNGRLRSILKQQISSLSQMPGSSMRALQYSSQTRISTVSIWSRLQQAAHLAPGYAIEQRDLICSLLDQQDPSEKSLSNYLQDLKFDNATEDKSHDVSWLVARDTLLGAVDLIAAYRQRQLTNAR